MTFPMSLVLPLQARAIIDATNFAHLATLMPDGSPQVTPVWIDREGDTLRINTAVGRVKHRNVLRDPRVAVSIHVQENPYERVVIRGRVVEVTTEGAEAHIDTLSRKYIGRDFARIPDQIRVIFRIQPESVAR